MKDALARSSTSMAAHPGRTRMVEALAAGRVAVLRAADGSSATLEDGELVLRSPAGEAVVRYDAKAGVRVIAPDGDLTLAAPKGRVVVQAGTEVVLEGSERLRVGFPEIELRAERITGRSNEISLDASRLELRATELLEVVGRWELRAERIVESAKDVYRDVAELLQQRAGRVRTLVRGMSQLVAGRTEILSDEDTVVDGKRVLLG